MVRMIIVNKAKITTIPPNGFLSPKKTMLHKALSNNWNTKWYNAVFTHMWWYPLLQTIPAATPIIMYRAVHTGANNQLGGVKDGLFRVTYQSLTELWVAMLDKNPIARQTNTLTVM